MRADLTRRPRRIHALCFTLTLSLGLAVSSLSVGQERGNPVGEWRYQSADAWGTRYSPVDQINGENFEELEIAWIFRGDNFSPQPQTTSRSTPSYIDGMLYTVAGSRRTVVAIDPATGETIWTYREPNTQRWERSMRASYGKGVGYAEVDGNGVIYIITPGFFLHALDARTGRPLENWGKAVPLEGFSETGVVDLLLDLLADWGPWKEYEGAYDPDYGVPRELGYITSSSPPIIVNGTVVVGSSAEQGYNQTRIENVPNDILAYDARTGEFRWKFHVIPRPGEFGHETWENDAWSYTGDVSSWAPLSADDERGIVYIPTNPPTIDYFGGFRPGANLYGTSVIALDVATGERVWHFQTVHNDQWNYDLPNVPILVDLTVEGTEIPAVVQTTKQGFIFAFNRETGEPIWPIEERPVPQTEVPGNWTAPTQPYPTKPEPFEAMGLDEDRVIDFTTELKEMALETMLEYRIGDPYLPRLPVGHDSGVRGNIRCYGGLNITHPAAMDPTTGILYVSHSPGCSGGFVAPGADQDDPDDTSTTGTTISEWVAGPAGRIPGPRGLPIFKPPYNRVSAYDMNTGERLYWVPIGETPENVKNRAVEAGIDLPNSGGGSHAILMVTGSLLLTSEVLADNRPVLSARDKATGELLGSVELPAPAQYGMMTYLHEGQQYIVVQIGGPDYPSSLVALALK
ncbi:MAG: PQQ-binding-like beta-propeller repeat protein [Acidobacteria bacterium]|nr:PQQ-binding-like beta-propeller repeat protein [Acidobacteriota bacterium]